MLPTDAPPDDPQAAVPAPGQAAPDPSVMKTDTFDRDEPDPSEERAALVKRMQQSIKRDKTHWETKAFKRMKESRKLTRDGADPAWKAAGLYVSNIVQRHVAQKTASLYAKNPKVRVDRRPSMDFKLWDGSAATLQSAAMDPLNNMELIQDVQQGAMRRKMLDGVAQTLQIVANEQLDTQKPPFKHNMKKMLRRTIIDGVGYVKLGYTRHMQPVPEVITMTSNIEARLAYIEALLADEQDDETDALSAECEQLTLALQELQQAKQQVSDEGLRFDYPKSDSIIPDRGLKDLRGFVGCDYVTEENLWTAQQVEELFGVDIGSVGAVMYHPEEDRVLQSGERNADDEKDQRRVCVWCCYHRRDGLVYWMVDGYKDFLSDPSPPSITLKRFYPWFALTLNISEDDHNPYPPSDVELITHQQNEYNRSRQGLRDHRIAARPKWVTPKGSLDDEDLTALTTADAHAVVQLNGLTPDAKIGDKLQLIKHDGIDPAMYDVSNVFQDIQRTVGVSQADMGAPAGVTATEASIGENSHLASDSSAADDLDLLLSEMMQEAGDVLLMEMDAATVTKIVGAGAVWPQIAPEDILGAVFLDIEAGSSGRPNKQAEIQAFERIAPLLIQMPGVNPEWLVKQAVTRMDDRLDPADAVLDGVPSILAMARIHQQQAMGAPFPGSVQPGDPKQPQQGAPQQGEPQQGPPGQAPVPQPGKDGVPHPAGPRPGNPNPMAAPDNQGPAGAFNTPKPPGSMFSPPAMPGPGPGTAPMGRG